MRKIVLNSSTELVPIWAYFNLASLSSAPFFIFHLWVRLLVFCYIPCGTAEQWYLDGWMHWFAALCPKIRLFCFRSQITPRPSKEEDNQALTFPEITNFYVVKRFIMGIKAQIAIWCLCLFQLGKLLARFAIPGESCIQFYVVGSSFKTGFESGLICYQCVGTHPGCGLHDFDWRWYWGKICPRSDDRCVKVSLFSKLKNP